MNHCPSLGLVLIIGLMLAGCANQPLETFRGTVTNLRGDGHAETVRLDLQRYDARFKSGELCLALRLGLQDCWLVLVHPPIKPDVILRAETDPPKVYAWLVRTKSFYLTEQYLVNPESLLNFPNSERLHGRVEMSTVSWRHFDNLRIGVNLVGENGGTRLQGEFVRDRKTGFSLEPVIFSAYLLWYGWDGAKESVRLLEKPKPSTQAH